LLIAAIAAIVALIVISFSGFGGRGGPGLWIPAQEAASVAAASAGWRRRLFRRWRRLRRRRRFGRVETDVSQRRNDPDKLQRLGRPLPHRSPQRAAAILAQALKRIEDAIAAASVTTEARSASRRGVAAALADPARSRAARAGAGVVRTARRVGHRAQQRRADLRAARRQGRRDRADRGVDRESGQDAWQAICHAMESAFREGRFERVRSTGIHGDQQAPCATFSAPRRRPNELPDQPIVL